MFTGGVIIAAGHFTLAIPTDQTFYLGLVLVILGTGFLKPNISAIIGDLYPEGGARRDAGFSIFYMGINLGAALGPFICSWLGEKHNWHYGFGAAGVGMVLGLIQYKITAKHLGEAGLHPGHREGATPRHWAMFYGGLGLIALVVVLGLTGVIKINPVSLARATTYIIVGVALVYFTLVFVFFKLDPTEKKRVWAIVVLFVAAAMFWSGFEQAGSSLNLFADRYTARVLTWFHFEIPAGWFQMLNPIYIITLAPVMAWLWVALARRCMNPSLPVKFAAGLLLLGLGFLVMAGASKIVAAGHKVWPSWLITTYLLHSVGELCLSPVGLSSVTKLSPKRLVGQMMGVWFLAASLGNLFAGLIAGEFNANAVDEMSVRYFHIVLTSVGAGVMLLIFAKPIKKLTVGIE